MSSRPSRSASAFATSRSAASPRSATTWPSRRRAARRPCAAPRGPARAAAAVSSRPRPARHPAARRMLHHAAGVAVGTLRASAQRLGSSCAHPGPIGGRAGRVQSWRGRRPAVRLRGSGRLLSAGALLRRCFGARFAGRSSALPPSSVDEVPEPVRATASSASSGAVTQEVAGRDVAAARSAGRPPPGRGTRCRRGCARRAGGPARAHPVAVVLPVLREQDQRCRVGGLQAEDQREQGVVQRPRVELQVARREGVPERARPPRRPSCRPGTRACP